MLVGPSSFDVIIGIDQLLKYHAVIVRGKEIVRIPHGVTCHSVRRNSDRRQTAFRGRARGNYGLIGQTVETKPHPNCQGSMNSNRGPEFTVNVKINSATSIHTSLPTPLRKATQTEFQDEILLTWGNCDNPYFSGH
ncbi:hypothetical protein Tco_0374245 [Tanacetum coccineum]